MLNKLKDKNATQQCEINIADSKKRIDFLQRELNKLEQSTVNWDEEMTSEEPASLTKRISAPTFTIDQRDKVDGHPAFNSMVRLDSKTSNSSNSVFSSILSTLGFKGSSSGTRNTEITNEKGRMLQAEIQLETKTIFGSIYLKTIQLLINF